MKPQRSFLEQPGFSKVLLERLGQSATLVIDAEETIVYASKRAERLLGVAAKKIIGKNFFLAVPLLDATGGELPERKRPTWQALHTKNYNQVTPFFCHYKKGKETIPVALNALQVKEGRTVRGAVVEIREVKRVLNVGEMKSLFVSFAAHQLKTPSSIVKGFMELMLREGQKAYEPEQWYNLQSAFEANENLIALSKTLLNLTRLEGGLIEPNTAPFNPHAVLRNKIASRELLLQAKGVKVKLTKQGPAKSFLSDEMFFSEIYEILFGNALKYSPPGSVITINCITRPHELVVEVLDEGPGVAPEIKETLFRAASAVDPANNSHGLGLLMARKYVSLLHGTIGLREQPARKGAAFFFSIPKPIL